MTSAAATEIAAVLKQCIGVLVNEELQAELAAEVARVIGKAAELQARDAWLSSLDHHKRKSV